MYLGDPRDVRRYMTLSQVGLEMVAPIGLGLAGGLLPGVVAVGRDRRARCSASRAAWSI